MDTDDLENVTNLLEKTINNNSLFLPHTQSGEEYVVTTQKKKPKHKLPPFVAIAGGPYMRDVTNSLLHKIGKMNAAERWFFLYLHERMAFDTNIAVIKSAKLTSTQITYKTRAYKTLTKQGLVKRVKREHYIINPDMIVPLSTYPTVKKQWELL